jgi:hypothetical protein
LSYQWSRNNSAIAGATGASLLLPNVSQADVGSYQVKVTGLCGSVESNPAALIISEPVKISRQPQDVETCISGAFVLNVAATGIGPLTYQWRKDDAVISGATAENHAIEGVKVLDSGAYTVVVTGPCGSVIMIRCARDQLSNPMSRRLVWRPRPMIRW